MIEWIVHGFYRLYLKLSVKLQISYIVRWWVNEGNSIIERFEENNLKIHVHIMLESWRDAPGCEQESG